MNDIPAYAPMIKAGKEKFLEKLQQREEMAKTLAMEKGAEPQDSADITSASGAQGALKEWTVLCYIDGHNDLEAYAAHSMLDLESAGSNKDVNVLAELGRISQDQLKEIEGSSYEPTNIDGDWSGIRRYVVKKDDPSDAAAVKQINSILVENLGEKDMSNPKTLADFLTWGIKNYPAKHYLVALMDHGGGWLGAFTDDATASGNHIMSTPQIGQAFREVEKNTGVKPEVIDMVACLMGSGEVAYELRNNAQFMTGSEEIATTDAFMYSPVIEHLQKSIASPEGISAKELAKFIVNYYVDKPNAFVTKSAMDLSRINDVKDAVNTLAVALQKTDTKPSLLKEAINKSQHFSQNYYIEFYSHIRDLHSLAEQIAKSPDIKDPELKVANITASSKDEDSKEKYLAEGISIYAPTDKAYGGHTYNMRNYGQLQLPKDTQWDEFIIKNNEQT
jgi:hypothetical protein